jgi:hypothetical protein
MAEDPDSSSDWRVESARDWHKYAQGLRESAAHLRELAKVNRLMGYTDFARDLDRMAKRNVANAREDDRHAEECEAWIRDRPRS